MLKTIIAVRLYFHKAMKITIPSKILSNFHHPLEGGEFKAYSYTQGFPSLGGVD